MANLNEAFSQIESKLPPLQNTVDLIPNNEYVNNIYVNAANSFALRIQRYLPSGSVSPFSIFFIMSLLYIAARGETRSQLAKVLSIQSGISNNDFINSIFEIYGQLTKSMTIFNGILVPDRNYLNPSFVQLFNQIGEIERFSANDQQSTIRINKKIEQMTHGRIKNIVPIINNLTRFVIINAIYFKMDWQKGFDPYDTRVSDFYSVNGAAKQVKFMIQTNTFNYHEDSVAQYCELNYISQNKNSRDVEYVFGIVLPKRGASLQTNYIMRIGMMKEKKVKVHLPKFTTRSNISLIPVLVKMGLKNLFDPKSCELNGMITNGDTYVSDVIHECFISIDEKGIEPVEESIVVTTNPSQKEQEFILRADHTFLYYIRYVKYNLILFSGVYDG